jgi:hypothetical protein
VRQGQQRQPPPGRLTAENTWCALFSSEYDCAGKIVHIYREKERALKSWIGWLVVNIIRADIYSNALA